ncbi:MAG: threonine synthase [Ignavibacteriales bacterium]|nr:threonine synthase [Ignavibacteriales bacterium]
MSTYLTYLECTACGDRHTPHEVQTVCRSCGKILAARYDLAKAKHEISRKWFRERSPEMWNLMPLLPLENPAHVVSLGELVTPLIRLATLERRLGISRLLIKDESRLPTGSFKARGLAVAVSKAKELGITRVCIPSAGNAAGALAAYAARAGIEAHIFLPEDTPRINISECIASGAQVELVRGTISDAAKAMSERRREHPDWFDVSTMKEPYRLEGKKTMGYELAEQLEWILPDAIVYPAGGGTGLVGMWKAFEEMAELDLIGSKRPRMIAVQSEGCAPIVRAFDQKRRESEFWNNAATIASGLRVPKAFADYLILDILYKSGGHAVAVSDEEIRKAVADVARAEGLYCCPEGAATVVAVEKLLHKNILTAADSVVLWNTAAGTKYAELVERL